MAGVFQGAAKVVPRLSGPIWCEATANRSGRGNKAVLLTTQ